jgi:hypothetical protein
MEHDMGDAALIYLGINPPKPAVEFEIRLPKALVGDCRHPGLKGSSRPRKGAELESLRHPQKRILGDARICLCNPQFETLFKASGTG